MTIDNGPSFPYIEITKGNLAVSNLGYTKLCSLRHCLYMIGLFFKQLSSMLSLEAVVKKQPV